MIIFNYIYDIIEFIDDSEELECDYEDYEFV